METNVPDVTQHLVGRTDCDTRMNAHMNKHIQDTQEKLHNT